MTQAKSPYLMTQNILKHQNHKVLVQLKKFLTQSRVCCIYVLMPG